MPRQGIWKQHQRKTAPDYQQARRLLSFKSPPTVHLPLLTSVPHSGAFIPFTDPHQKVFSFPRLYSSLSFTERRRWDSFLTHENKRPIPLCLSSWRLPQHLLAGRQKCKTCIHFFSRLTSTGNSYEPSAIAAAS